jgi:hypothetical protein
MGQKSNFHPRNPPQITLKSSPQAKMRQVRGVRICVCVFLYSGDKQNYEALPENTKAAI